MVIVNHSRSAEVAGAVVESIREEGYKAEAIQADVSDRVMVERMVEQVVSWFGRIDILVNNAGVARDAPFLDLTDEDWDIVLGVNLRGSFICSQVVARRMLQQQAGKIINVSAAAGIRGRRNGANYCAAKAGVIVLTKCLALELAPYVQVNCLLPGFTETDEVVTRFRLNDPETRQQVLQTIPMGRFATTHDIAQGALILASELSNYMTGQLLCVNGGSYM